MIPQPYFLESLTACIQNLHMSMAVPMNRIPTPIQRQRVRPDLDISPLGSCQTTCSVPKPNQTSSPDNEKIYDAGCNGP
jgi:hypothetical protein